MKILNLILIIAMGHSLTACSSDSIKVEVSITNRSSAVIDSVTEYKTPPIITNIQPGQSKTVTIVIPKEDTYWEGAKDIRIYTKGKMYAASCCLHDWGAMSSLKENIYVFDHGFTLKDSPILPPDKFSVFLMNKSGLEFEIPGELNPLVIQQNKNEVHTKIVVPYLAFSKNPVLTILQGGKTYPVTIQNDWENYNVRHRGIYLHPDGKIVHE